MYEKGGMHGSAHTSSDGRSRGHRMQSTVRSDSVSKWPFLPCSIFRGSWQWREQPQLILWQQGGEERSVITVPAPGHTPAGIPFCYQMFSLPTCFPESLTCTVSHAFQGVSHVQSPHDFLGVSHVQSPRDFLGVSLQSPHILPWESRPLNSLDFPESPICTQSPPCASFLASSLLNPTPSQSAAACRVRYAGCLYASLDHRLHQNQDALVTCRPLYPHPPCPPFEVLSRAWLIASFLTAASAPSRFWGRAVDAHLLLLPFVIVHRLLEPG